MYTSRHSLDGIAVTSIYPSTHPSILQSEGYHRKFCVLLTFDQRKLECRVYVNSILSCPIAFTLLADYKLCDQC